MRLLLPFLWVFSTMLATTPSAAQQFQYDDAGRLTAAIYSSGASIRYEYDANSNITRIAYDDGVADPVAPNGVIDTPTGNVSIEAGRSVNFSGTASDPDNATPFSYLWDFNGGAANSTVEDPGNVTFATVGIFTVTFTVTDATNLADPTPDSVVVTVTAASTGGEGNAGGNSSGGGAAFFLPLLLALVLLARKCRPLLLVTLLLAGGAQAQEWTEMTSGTSENLRGVWMESANLAYAVGNNGTVLRFDGADWNPVDVGTTVQLNAVWGTSANDVWVVGASGTVLHFDGASWTPVDIGAGTLPLNDVWTSGATQTVHVVGGRGAWEYDGVSWNRQTVGVGANGSANDPLHNMTAIRGTDNFLVMTANDAFGLDEGLWVNYDWVGLNTFIHDAVWVYDDTFMLAVGPVTKRMQNGDPTSRSAAWEDYGIGMRARAVWGTSPTSIWAAGEIGTSGRILYGDGTADVAWTPQLTVSFRQFYGLHGVDDQTIMAVGTLGVIYAYFAEPPEPPTPTSSNFFFSYTNDDGVNTLTGELVRAETDFALPGDVPLYFERYYAGALSNNTDLPLPFGESWSHSYNWVCVQNVAPNQVKIVDYRGTEFLFENNGSGYNLVTPGSANVGLVDSGSELIFYDRESSQRAYFDPATCRLTEIKDRHGNSVFMNYTGTNLTSISDAHGSLIDLTYNGINQIETVSVVRDTTLSRAYTYTADGLLETTVSPRGAETVYEYLNGFFVSATYAAGTADETTRTVYEHTDGKVSASVLTGGGRTEYAYNEANNTTTITQPDGSTRTIEHNDDGQVVRDVSAEGVEETFAYDMQGRSRTFTDGMGRTTETTYDATSGRISTVTEPGGSQTAFTYESWVLPDGVTFYNVKTITRPDGGVTTLTYDANGNVVEIEDPEGNITTFTWDSHGNMLSRTSNSGGTQSYSYNDRRQVLTHTDSNGNTTTHAYDEFGRRTGRTDATGTIEATYSNRPLPDQVTYPSGANTQVLYDALDRIARQNVSDGRYLEFDYDAAGNLISLDHSGLDAITASYDSSGYVSSLSRNGFLKRSLAYNDDGQPQTITDGEDNTWQFEYGSDGAMIGLVRPNASQINFGRDADPRGLVTSVTSGSDVTRFEYDSVGYMARVEDPQGRSMNFERNLNGDVETATLGPVNIQGSYTRNEFGDWIRYVDPIGGTYTRDFGSDYLLDSQTDAAGNTVVITRDEKNRPETIRYDDGLSITATYGTNDLLQQIIGSDGAIINFDTTIEGLLIGGTNFTLTPTPTGNVSENNGMQATFDNQDRVARLTMPSGFFIDYTYNANDAVTGIMDSAGGVTTIDRDPFSNIEIMTTPDGRTTTYQRNDDGSITVIDMSGLGSMTATRGPGGRLESLTSTVGDPPDIPDEIREFSYDIASQKTSESHDVRGNALTNGDVDITLDVLGRIREIDDGSESTTYELDLFGNVVSKTSGFDSRVFVQNYVFGEPHISIEEDGSGNVMWNYVSTPDGRLIYRINPGNERQYYHFDLSGNTIMITDDTGDPLNIYVYAPHGEVIVREETVDNFLTTGGQFGAFEMADGQTISLKGKYIDATSGYKLSANSFAARASSCFTSAGGPPNPGRSMQPGYELNTQSNSGSCANSESSEVYTYLREHAKIPSRTQEVQAQEPNGFGHWDAYDLGGGLGSFALVEPIPRNRSAQDLNPFGFGSQYLIGSSAETERANPSKETDGKSRKHAPNFGEFFGQLFGAQEVWPEDVFSGGFGAPDAGNTDRALDQNVRPPGDLLNVLDDSDLRYKSWVRRYDFTQAPGGKARFLEGYLTGPAKQKVTPPKSILVEVGPSLIL